MGIAHPQGLGVPAAMLGTGSSPRSGSFPALPSCQAPKEHSRGGWVEQKSHKIGATARMGSGGCDSTWDLPGLWDPGMVGVPFFGECPEVCAAS